MLRMIPTAQRLQYASQQNTTSSNTSDTLPQTLLPHALQLAHQTFVQLAIRRPLLLPPSHSKAGNDRQTNSLQTRSSIMEGRVWSDAHVLDEAEVLFVAV